MKGCIFTPMSNDQFIEDDVNLIDLGIRPLLNECSFNGRRDAMRRETFHPSKYEDSDLNVLGRLHEESEGAFLRTSASPFFGTRNIASLDW